MASKTTSEFNMRFSYDENLTEIPFDPDSFYQGILHLEKQAYEETNKIKKARLLSKAGELYRIYGDNFKSEKYLSEALKLLDESENLIDYFVAKFRLAHTYQKQQKYAKAISYFKELETGSVREKELNIYEDFVYQHTGKLYFDMKKYEEALFYFKKANEIRLKKGDAELLSSTNLAIKITLEKIRQLP